MLSTPKKENPTDPGKGIHILIPSWPSFAPSRIEDGMVASPSICRQNCRRRSLSSSKHADVEGTTHRRHKSMWPSHRNLGSALSWTRPGSQVHSRVQSSSVPSHWISAAWHSAMTAWSSTSCPLFLSSRHSFCTISSPSYIWRVTSFSKWVLICYLISPSLLLPSLSIVTHLVKETSSLTAVLLPPSNHFTVFSKHTQGNPCKKEIRLCQSQLSSGITLTWRKANLVTSADLASIFPSTFPSAPLLLQPSCF